MRKQTSLEHDLHILFPLPEWPGEFKGHAEFDSGDLKRNRACRILYWESRARLAVDALRFYQCSKQPGIANTALKAIGDLPIRPKLNEETLDKLLKEFHFV